MPGPQVWLPYIECGSAMAWEVQICQITFCQICDLTIFWSDGLKATSNPSLFRYFVRNSHEFWTGRKEVMPGPWERSVLSIRHCTHPRREPIYGATICLPYLLTCAASGKTFHILPYCMINEKYVKQYGSALDFGLKNSKLDNKTKSQYGIGFVRLFCL